MQLLDSLIGRAGSGPALPYDPSEESGWDALWTKYFVREPIQRQHQSELTLPELPANRDEMVDVLYLQAPPEDIRDRKVLEVGCGAGYLAKRIARHTGHYYGVEWSGLALSVARETCPDRATFYHVRQRRAIRRHAGTLDTALCRQFIIHQRFDRAVSLLNFYAGMLRPGGRVYADFWLDDFSRHNGDGVWGCREVGPRNNAVYRYQEADIAELAEQTGFTIEDTYDRPDKLRHFVTFRKA
jgi:SAM-dependent methyltransferase